ncbi:MAG: hypothetical protein IJ462_02720 [Clostridia bacterium]|nr:hypothetical protein [Clostridia bacterium]
MKKKIVSICLVLAILAVAVTGTLAYLTDTDQALNTMTLGDIEIDQTEWQRKTDANGFISTGTEDGYGYAPDMLEEFAQDKLMLPATGNAEWEEKTAGEEWQQSWAQIGAPGSNQMLGGDLGNVIDKIVTVENTGDNDVYYRTIILIEDPTGIDHSNFKTNHETIMLNRNSNARFDWNQTMAGAQQDSSDLEKIYDVMINGVRHYAVVATYTEKLAPAEVSRPTLLQAYMQGAVTNEEYALFGDKVTILAYTQAVQADGWSDGDGTYAAQRALNAAFGVLDADAIEALDWDLTDFVA